MAFGCELDFAGVYTEGIGHVSPQDIVFAEELGYPSADAARKAYYAAQARLLTRLGAHR